MRGRELVDAVFGDRPPARPPYLPIVGRLGWVLAQLSAEEFTVDAQTQAMAATQVAAALAADAVTVGYGTDPAVGADAAARARAMAPERAVMACLADPDVAGARAYCEAGVDVLVLLHPDCDAAGKLKTIANACRFYTLPVVLAAPDVDESPQLAASVGLTGAVVRAPAGDEPGVIGGGVSLDHVDGHAPTAPRPERFFWSFPDEAPADATPETLGRLGRRLTLG